MKKIFAVFLAVAMFFIASVGFASEQTGILIIAPAEFKTQDFIDIATKEFGESYNVSQKTQDSWAEFCWNNDIIDSDPQITKKILSEFISTTDFEKIIFLIFKDAKATSENLGETAIYRRRSLFGSLLSRNRIRHRSHIDVRVVVMNKDGETAKIFEEAYSDTSSGSEERANRYAFKKVCKNIHARLNDTAK